MGIVSVLVLVLVALNLSHESMAQSGCTTVLISLSPCLNYITGSSSTPSSSCCSQLGNVVQSQPQCLCSALGGGAASLGVTINQTRALELPAACDIQTPPASRCNGGGGAAAPAISPVSAPADSEPAETPTDTTGDGDFPTGTGTGSKSTPTTGGFLVPSSGNITKTSSFFYLMIIALLSMIIVM